MKKPGLRDRQEKAVEYIQRTVNDCTWRMEECQRTLTARDAGLLDIQDAQRDLSVQEDRRLFAKRLLLILDGER